MAALGEEKLKPSSVSWAWSCLGTVSNFLLCCGNFIMKVLFSYYWKGVSVSQLRASPVVLYCKPESGKRWKDLNCGSSPRL
jgi:hypothetical protein